MRIIFTTLSIIVLATRILIGQDLILDVWSDSAPSNNGLSGPELELENNRVANISEAKMYIYLPDKRLNTGAAVVLCPGGAYIREAMSHEGFEVAEWLKDNGITGIVLKYRLPNGHHQIPLEDAKRAIQLTRYHAKEWGVDPEKVGIGGASAGGHLASTLGTRFTYGNDNSDDPVEEFSSRPDFMLLLYPFIFFNKEYKNQSMMERLFGSDANNWELAKQYSSELNVTGQTPPTFLVLADNDNVVAPKHSIEFYLALKKYNVPAEIHIFQEGGHGFGITKMDFPVDQWPGLFYQWLKAIDIVE